jgi:hypothetical protein
MAGKNEPGAKVGRSGGRWLKPRLASRAKAVKAVVAAVPKPRRLTAIEIEGKIRKTATPIASRGCRRTAVDAAEPTELIWRLRRANCF